MVFAIDEATLGDIGAVFRAQTLQMTATHVEGFVMKVAGKTVSGRLLGSRVFILYFSY